MCKNSFYKLGLVWAAVAVSCSPNEDSIQPAQSTYALHAKASNGESLKEEYARVQYVKDGNQNFPVLVSTRRDSSGNIIGQRGYKLYCSDASTGASALVIAAGVTPARTAELPSETIDLEENDEWAERVKLDSNPILSCKSGTESNNKLYYATFKDPITNEMEDKFFILLSNQNGFYKDDATGKPILFMVGCKALIEAMGFEIGKAQYLNANQLSGTFAVYASDDQYDINCVSGSEPTFPIPVVNANPKHQTVTRGQAIVPVEFEKQIDGDYNIELRAKRDSCGNFQLNGTTLTGNIPYGFEKTTCSVDVEAKIRFPNGKVTSSLVSASFAIANAPVPTLVARPEHVKVRAGENVEVPLSVYIFDNSSTHIKWTTNECSSWLNLNGTYLTGTAPNNQNNEDITCKVVLVAKSLSHFTQSPPVTVNVTVKAWEIVWGNVNDLNQDGVSIGDAIEPIRLSAWVKDDISPNIKFKMKNSTCDWLKQSGDFITGKVPNKNDLKVTTCNAEVVAYPNGLEGQVESSPLKVSIEIFPWKNEIVLKREGTAHDFSVKGDDAIIMTQNDSSFFEYNENTGYWHHAKDVSLGTTTDVSENFAIFGEQYHDTNGLCLGAAYIVPRHSHTKKWQTEAAIEFLPPDNNTQRFGMSVAIGEEFAFIGAATRDLNGATGKIFVYRREAHSGEWNDNGVLVSPDKKHAALFGKSIAFDGTHLIVGQTHGSFPSEPGKAYIFAPNSVGKFESVAKLTAADKDKLNNFGATVSISQDYAIVGDPYEREVFIYQRNSDSGKWSETPDFELSRPVPAGPVYDSFGGAVSISGKYAVVGAGNSEIMGYKGAGAVYIYSLKQTCDQWNLMFKITSPNPRKEEYFGRSVAVNGKWLIVGAPAAYNVPGNVYVF